MVAHTIMTTTVRITINDSVWIVLLSAASIIVVAGVGWRTVKAQMQTVQAQKDGVQQQNLVTVGRDLQSNDQRTARSVVYHLGQNDGEHWAKSRNWSVDQKDAVELTCQLFELVIFMQDNDMLPPGSVADNWVNAVERCWIVALPLIHSREESEGLARLWPHIGDMGREQLKVQRIRPPWLKDLIKIAANERWIELPEWLRSEGRTIEST